MAESQCKIVKWGSTGNFYIRLAGLYFAGFSDPEYPPDNQTLWKRESDAKPFDSELSAKTQIQLIVSKRSIGDDSEFLELIDSWQDLYPSQRGATEELLILARLFYGKCEEDQGLR